MSKVSSTRHPARAGWLWLVLLLTGLSGCAHQTSLTRAEHPNRVTPCVRPTVQGLWRCDRATRLAEHQGPVAAHVEG